MNKMLVAALVAVGAGGYWYSQQAADVSASDNAVMAYIPADTPIFSAQLQPFPIKSYINSLSDAYKQSGANSLGEWEAEEDPRAKFFLSLTKSYLAAMQDGETFISTFGLAENIRSYFYTLGALPVLKIEVANADAIWALLDKAEGESGLAHVAGQLKGVNYRSYPLTEAADEEQINLVVAVNNSMLTMTIDTSFSEAALLETALGVTPVERSIVDAKIIEDIIAKHGFTDEGISYINHQEIITALTSTDGNQLARQLTKLFAMADEDPFAELRSATCSQELSSIATNWPRTVAGYDELAITDSESSLSYRMVFESNNQVMLDAYQKMRGYIPAYVQDIDNSVFSFGLGIDVNQMVPSLQGIWDEMLTPQYQCAPLQEMQVQMSQQSPAMLGMMTGMANGVKGVGLSIIDYKISEDVDAPEIESLDAVVTLSADNPAMLFNMVKPFAPELADIQLPTDGSAVVLNDVLPMPPEMNITAKMAVKGNHLVLYFGDKGEAVADKLASETVANNGLLAMSVDYMKMFAPLLTFIELTGEPVPEEFKSMKDYDMRVKVALDVDDKGIIIDSSVNSRATK